MCDEAYRSLIELGWVLVEANSALRTRIMHSENRSRNPAPVPQWSGTFYERCDDRTIHAAVNLSPSENTYVIARRKCAGVNSRVTIAEMPRNFIESVSLFLKDKIVFLFVRCCRIGE